MVELDLTDYQNLIKLLMDVPRLSTEDSRRQVLEFAGLKGLSRYIDVSGDQFSAVSEIVSRLADYGHLTYKGNEALGMFLNALKTFVGVEQQETLDRLLLKYDMMTPVAPAPGVDRWYGSDTQETVAEKLIGASTLRPIAFLAQGMRAARSVAYVSVSGGGKRWSGTGFLVSSSLLITAHHVIETPDQAAQAVVRFNYEQDSLGRPRRLVEYRAKPKGTFRTTPGLDYSLVELVGEPGKRWGSLPLRPRDVKSGDRANIIQHPGGRPKEISFQNNFVEYVGRNVVQYVTSTEQGSSGSPVLDDEWQVVGLHHAGGDVTEETTQRSYFRNEGILISSIIADLPPELAVQVRGAAD